MGLCHCEGSQKVEPWICDSQRFLRSGRAGFNERCSVARRRRRRPVELVGSAGTVNSWLGGRELEPKEGLVKPLRPKLKA